ncbi:poly granule associated protein [Ramlibacter henchirensis]|uniref:Poly granule associated protein n=1 Tax=Ramlibacter henchirensis TaxID=204072 RepID=A0A4Z0C500_9BURK|nr:phasin family protein [Ramlibacter henchirensis]TFZ05155.1 poly granule associated protein [Ramlibacter henchirensis]
MVTKKQSTGADNESKGVPPFSSTVKESASQIWLAGLGAFAKAQEEGGKVFETLVKEGLSIQRKTQAAAEEKLSEAGSRMAGMATDISSKASGGWDKLETIFEERVSRALNKLGVPSSRDIDALAARIDELNRTLSKLSAQAGTKVRAARPAARATGAAKPARKSPRAARKTAAD